MMLNLWELLVTDTDPTPHPALAHSKMCFETLIRLYYLRHGFEAPNMFFMHFLLVQSFKSMATLKTLTSATPSVDDVQSTLILAGKGLRDQGRNYYLSETVYYILENWMNSEDAELMRKFVHVRKEDSKARQLRAKHLQSQILVDKVKITEHPEDKSLSNLIKQYRDTSLLSTSPEESTSLEESSDTGSSP